MKQPVLVTAAWPYANAFIHVGNLSGAYLPADIFARYQRLKGRDTLFVSGTDAHGTPITVRADDEKTTPEVIYKRYHESFLDMQQKVGISYDLFTSTHTENHFKVSQDIFLALQENGYLYKATEKQWYAPSQEKFLPDRYVEGTCYICGYDNARGDQCDKCGNLLDPEKLINPRSKIDGSTPELRETEHFYLDLGKLQNRVVDFLKSREDYWRPNVIRQSLGQILAEDLHGRAITRDLEWGIPVPVQDAVGKCLYVWFEAVIGYLSASIEWAKLQGTPDIWKDWWEDDTCKSYYFIGKDNIPFHAVIWPAQLIGTGTKFGVYFEGKENKPFVLPFDVPANEFMNLEGKKISGSRNWAIYVNDFLERYDPDPLRYYLTVNMPESQDTDWDWEDFLKRNNNELVATWGNLANRVISFANKHWGQVPDPGTLEMEDQDLIDTIESGFLTVGDEYEAVHLRAALAETMRLATEVNRYLDIAAPWQLIKTDKEAAGRKIYTALQAINNLKVLFSPVLPFTSQKLHNMLGYSSNLFGEQVIKTVEDNLGEHRVNTYDASEAIGSWQPAELPVGQKFGEVCPLFKKLDTSIVDEERARLG
ncbi:MAG TPA: methionine--tRNA ligase [Flexilinea sp.]|jgi:methionyl-tRNA synthetase|nr:methionine--tRNA ligase [Flexilinea sp.]OQA28080.1 MAG: Methionine--tRNA ligase [Chloroflexi bacterium ADurb.Bin344]HOG21225.1 methionine--tRNA ligase [Flexilinea sp.]HOP02068.1 methionine--tRNA ligase [Flexilinea sp.]HOR55276.1 methionine--tRNA ligase [Flexilinea sp.]